jgi:hypothetical protein
MSISVMEFFLFYVVFWLYFQIKPTEIVVGLSDQKWNGFCKNVRFQKDRITPKINDKKIINHEKLKVICVIMHYLIRYWFNIHDLATKKIITDS